MAKETIHEVDIESGILVLSGYGIDLRVERGHLIAQDGIADERRTIRLSRVQPGLDRVVVIGTAGTVTLDALQWIHDVEAAFVQIGYDGKVITTSARKGRSNSELLRAQALVSATDAAEELSRQILLRKIEAQLAVLHEIDGADTGRSRLQEYLDQLPDEVTGEELLRLEANAAKDYWAELAGLEVSFSEPRRVPDHWRAFGLRGSPYSSGNRHATTPANAILNYLYAVLEAETRIACLAVGLDPSLGVFHSIQRGRDSFVFDLMEPVRPIVDNFVLDLLGDRTFEKSDFFENRKGVVRIMPPLARDLSETASRWRAVVGTTVEEVASTLLEIGGKGRRGALARSDGATAKASGWETPHTNRQKREDRAREERKRELEKLWARHEDWIREEDRGLLEEEDFEKRVLPNLQDVALNDIIEATGLSRSYACEIRQGKHVPHRRHWRVLHRLAIGDNLKRQPTGPR